MENPAKGGVSECRTGWLDTPDDTRKIHNPQAAARAISAEVATTQPLAGPRFERQVVCVHALGPRPLAELLAEIAAVTGQPAIVADRLQTYARLDPEIVRAVGGDQFPPRLLCAVRLNDEVPV